MMHNQETTIKSAVISSEPRSLNRDFVLNVIRQIVTACSEGRGSVMVKNPCNAFVKAARSGKYDQLTDQQYYELLGNVEWASNNLWNRQDHISYQDMFHNLIALSHLSLKTTTHISMALRNNLNEAGTIHWCEGFASDLCFNFFEEETGNDSLPGKMADDLNPHQIYDQLSQSIYGQEAAKKAASMLLWNHLHDRKRNLLFAGPTGCGKTALWEAMKKIYPCILIIDATKLTREGWKGSFKINNIFDSLNAADACHSIIVIDEADKFFEPQTDSGNENVSYQIQSELLKLMEGTELTRSDHQIVDTSHVSFVFLGSFQLMQKMKTDAAEKALKAGNISEADHILNHEGITTEDLVSFAGVRQEIAGRIDTCITMQTMTAEDFFQILNTESMSPLSFLEKQYGITIDLSERQKYVLCKEAADSHLGVRYLRSQLQQRLDELLFEHPDQKEYLLYEEA